MGRPARKVRVILVPADIPWEEAVRRFGRATEVLLRIASRVEAVETADAPDPPDADPAASADAQADKGIRPSSP